MGENPGRRGEGSVTNRLSHGRPIKESAFVARLRLQISKKIKKKYLFTVGAMFK
jgi:hypothetical protein